MEMEIGGRLRRDMKSRLRTTLLKFESVRRARKRYSFTRRRMYGFSVSGSVRLCSFWWLCLMLCLVGAPANPKILGLLRLLLPGAAYGPRACLSRCTA